jgi:hypothetical protein
LILFQFAGGRRARKVEDGRRGFVAEFDEIPVTPVFDHHSGATDAAGKEWWG